VAPPGGRGEASPYVWTSKKYVICVCCHCHGTSSYHTTNTLQGGRAKSHVDTQTIQPGLGTSYSRPPIDPYLTFPRYKIMAATLPYTESAHILVRTFWYRWELVQGRLQRVWRRDRFGFRTASGPRCVLVVVGVNPTAASVASLSH